MADRQSTFIQLPLDVSDPIQLRRFLDKLVQQLDISFGNRGDSPFVSANHFLSGIGTIQDLIGALEKEALTYSKIDGSRDYTAIVKYSSDRVFSTGSNQLVDVKYTEDTYEPKFSKNTSFNKDFGTTSGTVTEGGTTTNNPEQASISDLTQVISNPPTQAEVQAIQDKVNSVLSSLRLANIISS